MNNHDTKKHSLFQAICLLLNSMHWSIDLIHQAEQHSNLQTNYYKLLFQNGKHQLIQEFEQWLDNKMLKTLDNLHQSQHVQERIALALETRIINLVSKNVILKNSSLFLIPSHQCASQKSAYHTCDVIWKYAGDTSTDLKYYTKRGMLLTIYLLSTTFYIADRSTNHIETKQFIKNALDNVRHIAKLKKHIRLPTIENIPILRLFL